MLLATLGCDTTSTPPRRPTGPTLRAVRPPPGRPRGTASPPIYEWVAQCSVPPGAASSSSRSKAGRTTGSTTWSPGCQVGLEGRPKLEMGRNYWDELGQGGRGGRRPSFPPPRPRHSSRRAAHPPRRACPWRPCVGSVLTQHARDQPSALQPELVGAPRVIELQAGPRCRQVVLGLERLDLPAPRCPSTRSTRPTDRVHGKAWLDNVIGPLADEPAFAEGIVRGARWRSASTVTSSARLLRDVGRRRGTEGGMTHDAARDPLTTHFGALKVTYDSRVLAPRQWTIAQSYWASEAAPGSPTGPILELHCGAGTSAWSPQAVESTARPDRSGPGRLRAREAERRPRRAGRADRGPGRGPATRAARRRALPDDHRRPSLRAHLRGRRHPDDPVDAIDGGKTASTGPRCLELVARHLDVRGCSSSSFERPSSRRRLRRCVGARGHRHPMHRRPRRPAGLQVEAPRGGQPVRRSAARAARCRRRADRSGGAR